MGCDIHVMLEQKVRTKDEPDGVWQVINTFNGVPLSAIWFPADEPIKVKDERMCGWWNVEGRNYEFFAALAGVRGDGPEPRGLPDDIAPLAQAWAESWEGDAHSHSWLYADEFTQLYMKHCLDEKVVSDYTAKRIAGEITAPIWVPIMHFYISPVPDDVQEKPHDLRFLFFFDN